MANSGPDTNGSQFFIPYGKQPHLDMKYTAFGKVFEVLDDLVKLEVDEKNYRQKKMVHLIRTRIHANPLADG